MEMLLDHELLAFSKSDLVGKKIQSRMSVEAVSERFLSLAYRKPLVVLRIIDSKKEAFKLRKQYAERFEVLTVSTHPEIEILIIIKNGDYDDYCKSKSFEKPSEYCSRKYGYRKKQGVFSSCFESVEELIFSIKQYDSMQTNDITLLSLLKKEKLPIS